MTSTSDLTAQMMAVSQFKQEPEPLPWKGERFRDLTGQQQDVFTLQGVVGGFVDHYVLDRERGDGTGTRIIRHFTQVEPVGSNSDEVKLTLLMYHAHMNTMTEALGRLGQGDFDNDLLRSLVDASGFFNHVGRFQEGSTVLSLIGSIYELARNPSHAVQFYEAAVESSKKDSGGHSLRTLKRESQLASALLSAGETLRASRLCRENLDTLERINFSGESEYWDTYIATGFCLIKCMKKHGENLEAGKVSGRVLQRASAELGHDNELVCMARDLLNR